MAVAALALATVVAASFAGGIGTDPPRASFVFETDGTDVIVTHYGGDDLDGEQIYVESAERGLLGNAAGTDGRACAENRTQLSQGTTCRVADAAYEQLYVVWQADDERAILDRRPADPTPTPTPTVTPAPTTVPTATPTETVVPNGTAAPNGTVTPTGTVLPNATATPDGGTTVPPVDGTGTPAANGTATPGAGTATDDGTGAPTGTTAGTPAGTEDGTATQPSTTTAPTATVSAE